MNPNIVIISATVAVVTLVLAIFAAFWLNQRNTEKLLEQMERRFDARFDALTAEFRSEIKRVDQRFDSVEHRLKLIEDLLARIFKPILPPGD